MSKIGKPMHPEEGEDEFLNFSSGAYIQFSHAQDCCEYNYPDFSSLDDTGFWEQDFDDLVLEAWEGGVNINGYALACYSEQNGYYSTELSLLVIDKDGNKIGEGQTYCEEKW